jgi:hypothetical protein
MFTFRTPSPVLLSTIVGIGLPFALGISGPAFSQPYKPIIKEAELPRGFPGYTPVGQVELKDYPAYRKASSSGAAEFWTLFMHIKQNNVKMTAPVEMDFGDPGAESPKKRRMSFLYERPDQGSAGTRESVEVSDVPPMKVLSIGCRGAQTATAIDEARQKLLKYLAVNKEKFTVAGPMRVMGYNSPFVPRDLNFFEVQIPVKAAKAD